MENVANSLDVSVCVPVVPPMVPVVTVPFSDVQVVCEVVFSDSDSECVEPQTFPLSRRREASVALDCETEMSMEGPPVKAVSEAVKRRHTPRTTLFRATPEFVRNRAPPPPEGTLLQQTATWPGPPGDHRH